MKASTAKDYCNGGKKTTIRLSDIEFIRRFALHIRVLLRRYLSNQGGSI
ncbi:MAG: hypothetical protein IH595_05255 [Bacteroidales bacterium]|nr:hypothetical protein [Bacteroidales bacterium]